jgi:hypothetical protein
VAVNGTAVALTPADKKRLQGPPLSTPFDNYDRLFASFDQGRVFDYNDQTVRAIKEMLRQDGQARKVEQVLTLPIRSAAWEIRKAPGGDTEYAYIKAQLEDKMGTVIDQLTTACSFWKAYFELTYGLDGDTVTVEAVDYRPPATCEAAWDPKSGKPMGFRQRIANPGGIITIQSGQRQRGDLPGYVTIDPERAFVYVHGSYREPITGISDLEVALWCYETIKKIQFLWFQFLEGQSLPKMVAYGDDTTQADLNAAAIADARASGVLGVARPSDPSARVFDIIESSGKGGAQFLEAINYLESKMSASVLAGFTDLAALATHQRGQGSYALSADQSEFFLAARQAVADEIAEAVSRDLFKQLCIQQFGSDCKPPTLEIGPLSKHDKERSVNMLNSLITAPQFNVPPAFVDLLITSTASYLGLPVDQVAQLVKDHPAQDPAMVKAQAGLVANGSLNPDGTPVDPNTVAPVVAPQPPDEQATALSHAVDIATHLVERVRSGQDPHTVLREMSELALTRHVRTQAGVERYGLPIGSPIDGSGGKPQAPPLDHLKAQADKLGPHSKAAADYKAALAKAPAANPAQQPAAKKKLTMQDLATKLKAQKQPAPAKAAPTKAAPVKTGKPTKAKTLSAQHKKDSLTGLSHDQLAALQRYTGDDYRGINGGLRTKPPGTKYSKVVGHIDTALAAKPLPERATVWRTVSGSAFGLTHGSNAAALKGKVFTEAGFMSTSTTNQRFPVTPPPVHLTFEVPPGVGGAYLEPITKNTTENELLLQRNLRYVITGVRYSSAKGGWTATARVLPATGGGS